MKKASLNDIAISLSVSKTLVSLVLNNKGDANGISQATQKRVFEKAKELNYKPNQMARSLRLGRSETIGLIVADISNTFYARIARKVEETAEKQGYNVFFCSSEESVEKEQKLIKMLKDRQVDGIILSTTQNNTSAFSDLLKEKFPFVLIDRNVPKLNSHSVVTDNLGGAKELTEHLIGLGHQKIGFMTISPSHLSTMQDRLKGYKEALKQNNLKYSPKLVQEINFNQIEEDTLEALKNLIKPPVNATAIFTANNSIARMCIRKIKELNLQIPRDIALVSFDDIELFEFNYPPITAISQPVEDIGEKAVEILIEQIKSQKQKTISYKQVVLPTNLKVRKSCGSYLRDL